MKVPGLLKNKYVLYALLVIGIVNVLGYVALQDYNSLALFVVMGLLSSYFSKNMSVNLLVAITVTSIVAVNNKVQEGFVEGKKELKKEERGEEKKVKPDPRAGRIYGNTGGGSDITPGALKKAGGVTKNIADLLGAGGGIQRKAKEQADAKKKVEEEKKKQEEEEKRREEEEEKPKEQKKKTEGSKCKAASECESGVCKKGVCGSKAGFQNNVPPSSPATVDGDDSVGERIDYAATMEQAYDNLQKMLGEDGMKGITHETKKLVSQQKDLMQTLNSMAPVLSTAKETLANMDLPSMGEMGKILKSFNNGAPKLK